MDKNMEKKVNLQETTWDLQQVKVTWVHQVNQVKAKVTWARWLQIWILLPLKVTIMHLMAIKQVKIMVWKAKAWICQSQVQLLTMTLEMECNSLHCASNLNLI
jgi:hypothetical protein